ncbi:MAG: trans-aconitate 2-methyltransferase [Janthinobacterium lividum]
MSSSTEWHAEQYSKFENERTRPVRDLMAAVPNSAAQRVIDIGCGPGNSTEVLAARYPDAQISGLDGSADMIAAARKRLPAYRFDQIDIETWNDTGPFDVILANAVLQWIPDHANLYPRLLSKLAMGGTLAVQMPDNLDEPAQRLIRDIAAQAPWAPKLPKSSRTPRQSAQWYYELLRPHCSRLDVWRTVYFHPMADGAAGVAEWFKGTGLRPYLNRLDAAEQTEFLNRYKKAVAHAYPALADGTVLLPFPRLFIVATR